MIIAVIVLGALVLALLVVVLRQQAVPKQDGGSALLLKEDLKTLSDDITKLKDGLNTQITERLDKNQELMRVFIPMRDNDAQQRIHVGGNMR